MSDINIDAIAQVERQILEDLRELARLAIDSDDTTLMNAANNTLRRVMWVCRQNLIQTPGTTVKRPHEHEFEAGL